MIYTEEKMSDQTKSVKQLETIRVDTGTVVVEGKVENIGEAISKALDRKNRQIPIEDFSRLVSWLTETAEVKSKREIVRNPRTAFEKPIVVITDRGAPSGVFLSFNAPAELPKEVKLFLLALMNAVSCKKIVVGEEDATTL